MQEHYLMRKGEAMQSENRSLTGRIFNIQHFCVDDGPGIRTTVFLKGCPLRCAWCHNPESYRAQTEILLRADRCSACGKCASVCPKGAHELNAEGHEYDRARCTACGTCVSQCLTGALERVGEDRTVSEVLAELCTDRVFYDTSGGGITLSGGEPTAQPAFSEALLAASKEEGLHTALETCGYCSVEIMERLIPLTDLFLLDWKITDEAEHKHYTGVSNRLVRENLALLCKNGAAVVLRCPLIPGVNMYKAHYDGIVALVQQYPGIQQIDLEPYHPMGLWKTRALGRTAEYTEQEFLSSNAAEEVRAYLAPHVSVPVLISGK